MMKINYLIEQAKTKVILPVKIKGTENCSDALTKPLGPVVFIPYAKQMLGKRQDPMKLHASND